VSNFGRNANIGQPSEPLSGEWSSRDTSQKLTYFTRLSVGQSGYETKVGGEEVLRGDTLTQLGVAQSIPG
jgi:hypothetical protein